MTAVQFNSTHYKMGNTSQNQSGESSSPEAMGDNSSKDSSSPNKKHKFSETELRARLNPIQYAVTQQKATERPYSGKYNEHKEDGHYLCVVCEQNLFTSNSKFDSHCGWPAFRKPSAECNVSHTEDFSHNMVRTEVTCSGCGAHLGHVFDDGPLPARTRYCINSAALKFIRGLPK